MQEFRGKILAIPAQLTLIEEMQFFLLQANTVMDYLVSNGTNTGRLNSTGLSFNSPIAAVKTNGRRAKNRRATLLFSAGPSLNFNAIFKKKSQIQQLLA
tara:strand:- start:155 stop:451 length:297 start_codon:yes stop_codon:yes gene_type:complete